MQKIGLGYDSHRLAPNRPLILCGVRVPSDLGLEGHSDADAALHAITDAIFGALADGDLGDHFPDSDPKWKDADSKAFLTFAMDLLRQRGMKVANCDVTIMLQQPKLSQYKPAMRKRTAEIMGIDPAVVSIKAKTNEHMGFVGRGEGVAALAAVLLTDD